MNRSIAIIPFGYLLTSRIHGVRDLAYLGGSSWLPAIWFIFRESSSSAFDSFVLFTAGYFAFIAIYEIGYLVNDQWDASRTDDGRARTRPFESYALVFTFVTVRLITWALIAFLTGWITNVAWLGGYIALSAALVIHNALPAGGLRGASFLQLAVFRFTLPVIGAIFSQSYQTLVFCAIVIYSYLRLISYLESKKVLMIDNRGSPLFGLTQIIAFVPLVLWYGMVTSSDVVFEILVYFFSLYFIWWTANKVKKVLPS